MFICIKARAVELHKTMQKGFFSFIFDCTVMAFVIGFMWYAFVVPGSYALGWMYYMYTSLPKPDEATLQLIIYSICFYLPAVFMIGIPLLVFSTPVSDPKLPFVIRHCR